MTYFAKNMVLVVLLWPPFDRMVAIPASSSKLLLRIHDLGNISSTQKARANTV